MLHKVSPLQGWQLSLGEEVCIWNRQVILGGHSFLLIYLHVQIAQKLSSWILSYLSLNKSIKSMKRWQWIVSDFQFEGCPLYHPQQLIFLTLWLGYWADYKSRICLTFSLSTDSLQFLFLLSMPQFSKQLERHLQLTSNFSWAFILCYNALCGLH